jgi:hypothetical protein
MTFLNEVVRFLEELELIGCEHGEVTDTDVRDAVYLVLNYHVVWGHPMTQVPQTFGMQSRIGDRLVADTVCRFVSRALNSGELRAVPVGQSRLDILQSNGARTANGAAYDEFIGHGDAPLPPTPLPSRIFREGTYATQED